MKKIVNMLLKVTPIVMVVVLLSTSVFGIDIAEPKGGTAISSIDKATKNIWETISGIVQMLAFCAMVVAGVRYMFASADAKADIKQQTVILLIGAVIVFAAVPIVEFVVGIVEGFIGTGSTAGTAT